MSGRGGGTNYQNKNLCFWAVGQFGRASARAVLPLRQVFTDVETSSARYGTFDEQVARSLEAHLKVITVVTWLVADSYSG